MGDCRRTRLLEMRLELVPLAHEGRHLGIQGMDSLAQVRDRDVLHSPPGPGQTDERHGRGGGGAGCGEQQRLTAEPGEDRSTFSSGQRDGTKGL